MLFRSSLDFGPVVVNAAGQLSLTVTNLGGTAVSNGTAVVGGPPFSIFSGATFSLPGFGKTNVAVRFQPTSVGSFTTTVVIASANGGTLSNQAVGVGAIAPNAQFTATNTNGPVPLVATFTDTSTGTITNRFWNFGDGTTFATNATVVSHTYPVGSSYNVSLTVSGPLGSNTRTQTNLIRALALPLQIITPSSLSFGSVVVGQTNSLDFSVVNNGDLDLTGTATTAGPYQIATPNPYIVPGHSTGTVSVSLIPIAPGTFNNNVAFNSNGGDSTNAVTGVGLAAGQLGVTPGLLNFGVVATGANSQMVFTVTNSGGSSVTNCNASATGGPFTIISPATFNLLAGASTNVSVRFAPVAPGDFTSAVVIASVNGGTTSNTVIGV